MHIPILYQDADYVVVSKPAGLLVHRSLLDRGETQFAMQLVRDQIGQHVFPVHRLDRPTSGALIFALSSGAARLMSEEFSARRVAKTYWAVVRGVPPASVRVDYPLREELDAMTDVISEKDAQSAVTEVWLLGSVELPFAVDRYPTSRYSLVEARPWTGRKHQIRRHLRHLGHPIVGDITHGVGKHNRFFEEHFKIRRLLLASVAVSFAHPVSGEMISVRAPLAEDFCRLLVAMGWSEHATAQA